MSSSNYAAFRYQISDDEALILADDQFSAFDEVKGLKSAYRVSEPQSYDYRNFIFDLEEKEHGDLSYFTFGVGYQITEAAEQQLDPSTEKVSLVWRDANDMRYTRGVFIPSLRVSAFKDGSGGLLAATAGIGRVKAIFEEHSDFTFDFSLTASNEDLESAVKNLNLIEMKFVVRPFNPHPSNPGMELDKLLRMAKVGKLVATAKPFDGGNLSPDDGGLVSEAQGLANKGYGQYGLTANTDDGATVKFKPKSFSGDKEKDQVSSEKPQLLHISVEKDIDEDGNEEQRIVKALVDIFGDDT